MNASGALLCLMLFGASPHGGPPAGPYIDNTLRFGVTPPPGWSIVRSADVVVAMLEPESHAAGPRRGAAPTPGFAAAAFRANITIISRLYRGASLKRYVDESRAGSRTNKWYRTIRERPTRLSGLPAVERDAQAAVPDRPIVRTREVMCMRGDRLFIVTLTAVPTAYKKHSDEFDKVLAGFTWRN